MSWLESFYAFFGFLYEPMFMKRSALALLLLSLATSGTGVLVVNRRLAFFPDAVGHSIFAGLALGFIFGLEPKLTVLGFGLLIGLLLTFLVHHSHLASDTVIGLVFSGAVALGLALVSREPSAMSYLGRYFLGDILTVGDSELMGLLALDGLALFFLSYFYNRLTLSAIGLETKGREAMLAEYAFGAFLSMVVVISVQAVGVLLVTALLVAPAATGRVLAKSGKAMFWIAIMVGIFSGQIGLYLSFLPEINTSAGASVVLVSIVFFILALGGKYLLKICDFGRKH